MRKCGKLSSRPSPTLGLHISWHLGSATEGHLKHNFDDPLIVCLQINGFHVLLFFKADEDPTSALSMMSAKPVYIAVIGESCLD